MNNNSNNNDNNATKELILGQRLQQFRKNARISQEEMANYCNLSRHYISAIERGLYKCNVYILIDYAKKLGVSLDVLTGLDDFEILPELRTELQNTKPEDQKKMLEILKILKQ